MVVDDDDDGPKKDDDLTEYDLDGYDDDDDDEDAGEGGVCPLLYVVPLDVVVVADTDET